MIDSSIQSMFQDSKLVNKPSILVEVEVDPSRLFEQLSAEVFSEISRVGSRTGLSELRDLEVTDVSAYLHTLVWLRVECVNGWANKSSRNYRSVARNCAVPVLVYQLLTSMGEALDRDYSIKFKPVYSIPEDKLLEPERFMVVSDILTRLENDGIKIVFGIPNKPEGELDFMALSHVEETVLSYHRGHPVYGFLASFFAMHQLNDTIGAMNRVVYGYDSDYSTYVSRINAAINKIKVTK